MSDRDPLSIEKYLGTLPFVPNDVKQHLIYLQNTPAFAKGDDEVPANFAFENTSFLDANPVSGYLRFPDIEGIILQVELGLDEVTLSEDDYTALLQTVRKIESFMRTARKQYAKDRTINVYGPDETKLGYFIGKGFIYGGQ